MRSKTLLSVILLWSAVSVNAQVAQERAVRLDIQIAQSFGLNDWNRVKFASDRLPHTSSSTDLRATLNVHVFRRTVGIFHDIGLGIMPAPRNGFSDPAEQAAFTMGVPYYTKEIVVENGNESASAHFKMTLGVFTKFSIVEKLSVSPCFGVGFMNITAPTCEVVLKEQDSNMQYIARYQWFGQDEYSYSNETMLSYLAFRLRFAYRILPKSNLLFGFEYTWFPIRADFSERYTNYFNHNIINTLNYKGNRLNMLGFSVGISL